MEDKPTSGSAPPATAQSDSNPISDVPPIDIIRRWAIGSRELGHAVSSQLFELVAMIAWRMNPKRDGEYRAWPGRGTIAKDMGCCEGKVKAALRQLRAHPLCPISQEIRGQHDAPIYRLTPSAFEAAGLLTPDCVAS
jgi:hypothetical protein